MKMLRWALITAAIFLTTACGSAKAPPPEKLSPFLEHADQLAPHKERSPFAATWVSDRQLIDALKLRYTNIVVAPVTLQFFENDPKDPLPDSIISKMADYFRSSVINGIQSEGSRFTVVDSATDNAFVAELALIRLVPTTPSVSVVENLAGLFVPGSVQVVGAVSVAGGSGAHFIGAGHVAMALRLSDAATGKVLAEMYDDRADQNALLMNMEDFTVWGNARKTMKEWGKEFSMLLNSPGTVQVSAPSDYRLFVW